MKKNYLNYVSLLTFAIAMANTMWAQRVKPVSSTEFSTTLQAGSGNSNLPTPSGSSQDRAYGTVIWSQDFASAATGGIPSGWTQTGPNQVWKKTFEGSSGAFSSKTATLNSTTKANGVLIFDADSVRTKNGTNLALSGQVISDQINLTGKPNVKLQFQQYFRLCCNTSTTTITVSVSNNGGTTWVDFDCRAPVAINNFPTNPQLYEVNISNATQSSNNVKVKFSFASESGTYFWQIDDVKIFEGPNNDIKMETPFVDFDYDDGGYYTQTPLSQLVPIGFRAAILNDGGLVQKNVKLKVDVSKGASVYNKTSTVLATLAAGVRDTLVIATANTFTLTPVAASLGTYTTTFTFMADSVDQNPSNNQFTRSFAVSDTVYARDNGLITGSTVTTLGPRNYINGRADGAVIASMYEFPKATKITSVSAYVASTSDIGADFEFVLYDTSLAVDLAVSSKYTIATAADKGIWVTKQFNYSVLAGQSLYIGMRCNGGSSTPPLSVYTLNDLSKIDVQRANGSTVFYLPLANSGAGGWFNVGASSPYIRLGISSILTGIDEYEAQNGLTLYQNIPNPASSSTVIKYNLEKNSEVKFSVYDLTGRKLFDKNEGNVMVGEHNINLDLTTFSKGVYFYTLTANGHSLTKKMVITE